MSTSDEEIYNNPLAYINRIKVVQKEQKIESERAEEARVHQLGSMILRHCMEAAKLNREFFELPNPLTVGQVKVLEERFFVSLKYRLPGTNPTSHRYEFVFTAPE